MTQILAHLAGCVVVVGSGLAGLVTALTLAPQPVVLVTRAGLGEQTSSAWAQGGIAAAIGPEDTAELHLSDTLAAGDGLCDVAVAAKILSQAPAVITMLERFGVRFDRGADGALTLGLEAAHSRNRIVHAGGDGSGAAILRALIEAVMQTPSITVLSGVEIRRLLVEGGRITGVLGANASGPLVLPTSNLVLATGGLGGLYDATTNPVNNFGHGIVLAARAGAELADMEFVQFHPTALDCARRPLPLVSEALRGEGAILVNNKGERFLADTPGAELAPRDVVARAISAEIARGGRVFIDARACLGRRFAKRFPTITRSCHEAGLDPSEDLVPVRPAVHYHMGGVATDCDGRSTVSGLWVVGEAASTGLHGANRLASNSLLEAAVMGMRAAQAIAGMPVSAGRIERFSLAMPVASDPSKVRPIVSRHLGVLRDAEGMREAIAALLPLATCESEASEPAAAGLLIAVFALLRQESRGAHARTDFPLLLAQTERGRMRLSDAIDIAQKSLPQSLARSA